MAEDKEIYQRKNGFILYKNYIKSVNKMTNEQAGELFKIILHYANTGELLTSEDPRVDTALDFIGERLEFDVQSYMESCRKNSENGSKGGRPKKEDEASDDDNEESAIKTSKNQKKPKKPNGSSEKPKKADTDTETDTDTDTDTGTETDTETEIKNKTSRRRLQGAGEEAAAENSDEQMRYGENQHLTTRGVIVQMENFANELTRKYWGRAAYESDVEKVYDKCYMPGTLPNGEWGAVFSPEKADLLRYAFQQAAIQNGCTWSYIEGIYKKFDERHISTVEKAVECEYAWQRGEIAV